MYRVYTNWYAVPVLAMAVVAATSALQNWLSNRRLRRSTLPRIVGDAESVVASVRRMADVGKADVQNGESHVFIFLNTLSNAVPVPRRTLALAARELPTLFNCYALACGSDLVADALKADVWNCVCAICEEALQVYCDADALSADITAAAASLATCTLLQRRYNICNFLPPSRRQQLHLYVLSQSVFAEAACRNASEGSMLRSLTVFAQLLRSACTPFEQLVLSALVLISVTRVSRLLTSATPPAIPSKVAYGLGTLNAVAEGATAAHTSWKGVLRCVRASLAGRVLAGATVGTLLSHLFAAAQDAASDELLRRFRVTIKMDTVLCLARFDFVADDTWRLPHRVYSALSDATNFSLTDVDRLLSLFSDGFQRCRTVCRAPLPCAAGWAMRQALHFLQRQWTRTCLMAAYVDAYAGESSAVPDTSSHDHRHNYSDAYTSVSGKNTLLHSNSARALRRGKSHFGLQVLLLAAADGTSDAAVSVREKLAAHTCWPLDPLPSLRATQRALKFLAGFGNTVLLAKYNAVQSLSANLEQNSDSLLFAESTALTGSSASPDPPPLSTLLGLLRSQGDDWYRSQQRQHQKKRPRTPTTLWAAPSTREAVVDRILKGLEGLPLMAALLASKWQRPAAPTVDEEQQLEVAFQVTRTIESGDLFAMPPARPFTPVSAFQFDIDVAQLRYREYGGYAQSIAAILYVQQTHQPLLDHGLPPPSVNITAPSWRVTFDHVSFHYPGTDRDVLHDVSFDVPSGGFLGVVGYSGAGKSTLLLLLARVYAPTRGQIYIDGCPIDRLPPRALRRRLGATWQGDGQPRFLDGLSVERNVAYGALHRASDTTVAQALTAACVDDVVSARPHGRRAFLQSCEWSGGELERLSVARALMVAPDEAGAYLFDECTGGLDAVTEARVFAAGLRTRCRVTQIMVSHRLSSVQSADEILVLAHGRVAERGTWSQLLAQEETSIFRTLYAAQVVG